MKNLFCHTAGRDEHKAHPKDAKSFMKLHFEVLFTIRFDEIVSIILVLLKDPKKKGMTDYG